MPAATIQRILDRLPDDVFIKDVPEVTEEFNARNKSFETEHPTLGATFADDWTSTNSDAAIFADDPGVTQLRVDLSGSSDEDIALILDEDYAFILGQWPSQGDFTVAPADFIQIQSDGLLHGGGEAITHILFNYAYVSNTDMPTAGLWTGQLLLDGSPIWTVDLFNGAALYVPNQEVELPALGGGFHTFGFRLVNAAAYTGDLPGFVIDNVRLIRRTTTLPTILWLILFGIATAQRAVHDERHGIKSLRRIAEAVEGDLQKLAADYGVTYPASLGLSDAQFRDLIRLCVVEPKKTTKALIDLIKVLTGATPTLIEDPAFDASLGLPPVLQIILAPLGLAPDGGRLVDFWFYG
jgi:hypothetical protein